MCLAGRDAEEVRSDPRGRLALPGFPQRRLHEHHPHAEQEAEDVHGQLRPVRPDPVRAGGEPDEAVQVGAGADLRHEGVHRPVRPRLRQAGPPGPEQGEDPRQDGARRSHREGRQRQGPRLPLHRRRQAPPARAAIRGGHLRLHPRQPHLQEPGFWRGPRLEDRAGRPQRRRQEHAAEADDRRPRAARRHGAAAQPPEDRPVPPAPRGEARHGHVGAAVHDQGVPGERRGEDEGRHRAVRADRQGAGDAHEEPVGRAAEPGDLRVAGVAAAAYAAAGRAHQPSGHRDDRLAGGGAERVGRRAGAGEPRLQADQPGGAGDLGL